MTGFDQAQSPRLGQRLPYEGTTVRMFTGSDLPEVSVTGQIIYRTDTQGLQVYNGEAWEDVVGGAFGLLTFVGAEPPSAQSVGDLWFDSNDGNHPYRAGATGTGSWVSLRDGSIAVAQSTADEALSDAAAAQSTADDAVSSASLAYTTAINAETTAVNAGDLASDAMTAAEAAQATADGAIRTYYQTSEPWPNGSTGHEDDMGDMWWDTDNDQAYRWNDTTKTWDLIQDNAIASALSAAQNAQTTADGKITAYYSTTAPATAEVGDIWYDTDNGNKVSYCTGVGPPAVWADLPAGINALDTTTVTAGNLGGTTPESLPQDLGGDMNDAVITSATIQTVDAPNQGIKWVDGTLKAYPPEGGTAFFDVDPAAGMVIVAGEGTFDSATVLESTELGGTTTIPVGASMQLAAGTQPPGSAPKVDGTYDTLQFEVSEAHGDFTYRQGWVTDGTYWYTAENGANFTEMVRLDNTGAHVSYGWSEPAAVTCGLAYHGGKIYQLIQLLDANDNRIADQYYVLRHATSTFTNDGNYAWTQSVGTKNPAIGVDKATGEIVIAQHRDANSDKLRMRWYTVPAGATGSLTDTGLTDTNLTYNYNLGGLLYGSFDFGSAGWVVSHWGTDSFHSIGTNGSEVSTYGWESSMPNKVGFDYVSRVASVTTTNLSTTVTATTGTFSLSDVGRGITGTGIPTESVITAFTNSGQVTISYAATASGTISATISAFVSMDKTGLMRYYTKLDHLSALADATNTRWVSSTYFRDQATDWETPQSNRASILPKKRSKIAVTTAALPASPGSNDPNQVQIYIGKSSTEPARTAMYRQTTPAVGVITASYSSLLTTGNNPPATNNFPDTTPAKIQGTTKRADGAPKVNIEGSGAANIDGLIPPSVILPYGGTSGTPPTGWLFCDGGSYNTALYPDLFAAIGYSYGGSGSTFNVPNTADRSLVGASGTKALGTTGGADTVTLTATNLPNHTHGGGTYAPTIARRAAAGTTGGVAMGSGTTQTDYTPAVTGDSGTGSGLNSTPVNVQNKYVAVKHIIKY